MNTKYPNGHNLTNGGKGFADSNNKYICEPNKPIVARVSHTNHSDCTKKLISVSLKESLKNETHRIQMMKHAQKQHCNQKFEKFKHATIDEKNIDQYIHLIKSNKNGHYIRIKIGKIKTTFSGKYETIEELTTTARIFILNLLKWQRDQIAGNPLESSLPLTNGNIFEELG
jgi:hypothetical protein